MNGLLPTYLVSPLTTALWWNITGRVKILKDDLAIPGTRRLHCFIPQSRDTVLTKRYSACSNSQSDQGFNKIRNYRICNMHFGSQWWLAQVLENDSGNGEVKLSLLSPNGPSRWYHYPPTPNIFLAPILTDILTVVEPRTTTGCSYSLAQNESKTATLKLKYLLNNVST